MSKLENDYVRLELIDGILHVTFKKNAYITLQIAKEIVNQRLIFMGSNNLPSLGKDEGLKGMDKEARDYLSSEEGIKQLKASALIVSSVFNKLLANFFIKVNFISLKIPVRVFTEENEALQWLEGFK
ncbi:MAG: hypothetical protein SFY32_01515 [Bacteroidota bacterium]|nr:hypothetical protein [Bacteroidota bacterium]